MPLGQIPIGEKAYPVPISRHSRIVDFQVLIDNGTSQPTISFAQFIPLFIAGSNGAVFDFGRLRYDVATGVTGTCTGKVRYVADGTAPSTSGTAITDNLSLKATADTMYTHVVTVANNKIPANALVYLDCSNTLGNPAAPQGLVYDYGYRQLTN